MKLPINALRVGRNELKDGTVINVNCKNNARLARMLHLGMPNCRCCGTRPSYIELNEVEPSVISETTTATHYATVIYANGQIATVDHWHPISKGGANDLSNFVAMCNQCNNLKADHIFKSVLDMRLYVMGLRLLRMVGLSLSFKEFRSHLLHQYTWHHII